MANNTTQTSIYTKDASAELQDSSNKLLKYAGAALGGGLLVQVSKDLLPNMWKDKSEEEINDLEDKLNVAEDVILASIPIGKAKTAAGLIIKGLWGLSKASHGADLGGKIGSILDSTIKQINSELQKDVLQK